MNALIKMRRKCGKISNISAGLIEISNHILGSLSWEGVYSEGLYLEDLYLEGILC